MHRTQTSESAPAGSQLSLLRRATSTLLIVLALLAGTASASVTPEPATAAVPGLKVIRASSASDSTAFKTVGLSCENGYTLLGGGVNSASIGAGRVSVLGVTPNATLTHLTVSASEVADGTTHNWQLAAYAICAKLPATAGVQLVSVTTPNDSTSPKSITANCPTGKQLIGVGGGATTKVFGKIAFTGILPDMSKQRTYAQGAELAGGTTATWSLAAHAICANAGAIPGLELAVRHTDWSQPSATVATAACPSGKKLISPAAAVWDAGHTVVLHQYPLRTDGVTVDTLAATTRGTPGSWMLSTYLICATP